MQFFFFLYSFSRVILAAADYELSHDVHDFEFAQPRGPGFTYCMMLYINVGRSVEHITGYYYLSRIRMRSNRIFIFFFRSDRRRVISRGP